jgi:hypothetical protein
MQVIFYKIDNKKLSLEELEQLIREGGGRTTH